MDEIDLNELKFLTGGVDHRTDSRYPLHLKIIIINEHAAENSRYQGKTKDISEQGCSFVYDHNVHFEHEVRILISLGHAKVVEASGRMLYTVFSSEFQMFRTGIKFSKFKRDGKQRLQHFLRQRIKY